MSGILHLTWLLLFATATNAEAGGASLVVWTDPALIAGGTAGAVVSWRSTGVAPPVLSGVLDVRADGDEPRKLDVLLEPDAADREGVFFGTAMFEVPRRTVRLCLKAHANGVTSAEFCTQVIRAELKDPTIVTCEDKARFTLLGLNETAIRDLNVTITWTVDKRASHSLTSHGFFAPSRESERTIGATTFMITGLLPGVTHVRVVIAVMSTRGGTSSAGGTVRVLSQNVPPPGSTGLTMQQTLTFPVEATKLTALPGNRVELHHGTAHVFNLSVGVPLSLEYAPRPIAADSTGALRACSAVRHELAVERVELSVGVRWESTLTECDLLGGRAVALLRLSVRGSDTEAVRAVRFDVSRLQNSLRESFSANSVPCWARAKWRNVLIEGSQGRIVRVFITELSDDCGTTSLAFPRSLPAQAFAGLVESASTHGAANTQGAVVAQQEVDAEAVLAAGRPTTNTFSADEVAAGRAWVRLPPTKANRWVEFLCAGTRKRKPLSEAFPEVSIHLGVLDLDCGAADTGRIRIAENPTFVLASEQRTQLCVSKRIFCGLSPDSAKTTTAVGCLGELIVRPVSPALVLERPVIPMMELRDAGKPLSLHVTIQGGFFSDIWLHHRSVRAMVLASVTIVKGSTAQWAACVAKWQPVLQPTAQREALLIIQPCPELRSTSLSSMPNMDNDGELLVEFRASPANAVTGDWPLAARSVRLQVEWPRATLEILRCDSCPFDDPTEMRRLLFDTTALASLVPEPSLREEQHQLGERISMSISENALKKHGAVVGVTLYGTSWRSELCTGNNASIPLAQTLVRGFDPTSTADSRAPFAAMAVFAADARAVAVRGRTLYLPIRPCTKDRAEYCNAMTLLANHTAGETQLTLDHSLTEANISLRVAGLVSVRPEAVLAAWMCWATRSSKPERQSCAACIPNGPGFIDLYFPEPFASEVSRDWVIARVVAGDSGRKLPIALHPKNRTVRAYFTAADVDGADEVEVRVKCDTFGPRLPRGTLAWKIQLCKSRAESGYAHVCRAIVAALRARIAYLVWMVNRPLLGFGPQAAVFFDPIPYVLVAICEWNRGTRWACGIVFVGFVVAVSPRGAHLRLIVFVTMISESLLFAMVP